MGSSVAAGKGIEVDVERIKATVSRALSRAGCELRISLSLNEMFYRKVEALEKAAPTPLQASLRQVMATAQ